MQGQLCRGGYWGPAEWPLASPGWVVWWACAPCPDSPLPQSSGGCSRRPRCVWPPVWPRLCLVSALSALPPLLACPCPPPGAGLLPNLHLPWCLPVQLLPGDTQRCPLLLGDPRFPERFSTTSELPQQLDIMEGHCSTGSTYLVLLKLFHMH